MSWGRRLRKKETETAALWIVAMTIEGRNHILYGISMSLHHPFIAGSLGMPVFCVILTPRAYCICHAASKWQWYSSSSSMPFHVTNLAKWHHLDLNILFFFLSLDYTVEALARQSSGKDVRESTKSQTVTDSSFTKQESKISQNKIKSFQESSYEY